MGMDPVTIGLIISAVGTAASIDASQDAKSAAKQSRAAQEKVASEQRAQNASQAAQERRQQIRDERVRRARIIQSSVNTGTSDSSGEIGAISSLSTQLASGIGSNLGRLQGAENISLFSQQEADARFNIAKADNQGRIGGTLVNQSGNLAQIGGYIAGSSIFTPKTDFIGTNSPTGPGE